MKYSFDARFELARRLSATFQRSASNCSMPIRWSAVIRCSCTLHTPSMSVCEDYIQRRIPVSRTMPRLRATTANVQSRRAILPPDLAYDGFQSPAAGPASGRVSPESHDAIATINA